MPSSLLILPASQISSVQSRHKASELLVYISTYGFLMIFFFLYLWVVVTNFFTKFDFQKVKEPHNCYSNFKFPFEGVPRPVHRPHKHPWTLVNDSCSKEIFFIFWVVFECAFSRQKYNLTITYGVGPRLLSSCKGPLWKSPAVTSHPNKLNAATVWSITRECEVTAPVKGGRLNTDP